MERAEGRRSKDREQAEGLQRDSRTINIMTLLLQAYWERVKQQLVMFIMSKPARPSVPLLLVSPLDVSSEAVQYNLNVYGLLDQKLIHSVRVDRLDNTIDYNSRVS